MYTGELLHDRIIGALELCCRRGEMLLIQNKRVNWETHQIGIPGNQSAQIFAKSDIDRWNIIERPDADIQHMTRCFRRLSR